MCDCVIYDVPMSTRDSNVSLSLHEVDYLILFEFCGMWNAECGKTLRCNFWNVPQVKFRKIHLFEILHSAKYTFPSLNGQCCVLELSSRLAYGKVSL